MNGAFNGQILAEKLSKLNNSQQSIETLSHWCIFHRKKAKQVVETWDRQFHSSPRDQWVPFLYLANDILQNSRRKGSEFVGEFWKVLPGALRDVFDNGDDFGRNAAMRLVDIWEERKVFGSRGQILKEELVGRNSLPLLENNIGKNSNSGKLKIAIVGALEKIASAYQIVHDGHVEEDTFLSKCKIAISCMEKIEKDVHDDRKIGDLHDSTLVEELQEQDSVLRQCIEQLEACELNRANLVSQLRDALQEQEFKLEQVRTQLQIAHSRSEQAGSLCQQLLSGNNIWQMLSRQSLADANMFSDISASLFQENQLVGDKGQAAMAAPIQPMAPFAETPAQVDENHKKTAAAVAAKLAASTSSAQMLSYVLSSLASEAASISSGLRTSSVPVGMSSEYPLEKRQRMEQHPSCSEDGLPYMIHPPPASPQTNSVRLQAAPLSQQTSPLSHPSAAMQHQASPSNMQPPSAGIQAQASPSNMQHCSANIQHQASPSNMQNCSANIQHQPSPSSMQHQCLNMPHQTSPSNIQHQASPSNIQHQSSPPMQNQVSSPMSHQVSSMQPPPPPPPPPPPQYMQGVGSMMGLPYGYGGGLRRPPPLPGYPIIGMPQGMPQYSIPPSPYQSFQPSDVGFYNQPPLPTAPPISRQ